MPTTRSRWPALVLAAALSAVPAAGGELALTFDDLPAQRAANLPGARVIEIMERLTASLTTEAVPAIGFVNERKLYSSGDIDPARVRLLEAWLDAGLELGNHTFSHPDLHRVTLQEFQRDLLRGEQVTRRLTAERGRPLRYFRHPFLHTGRSLAVQQALTRFLDGHGYRVAPVTIDNSEWIFARAYDQALDRADPALARRLTEAYLDYMERTTAHYERQARELLGRELPQVLLLHANALNARHLGELLQRLRARGTHFVTLDHALADTAYDAPSDYIGPAGISWLHRWALARGVERRFFDGEPTTPDWVQEVAGISE